VTDEPAITFVASYPKSGNTWFRVFASAMAGGTSLQSAPLNGLGLVPSAASRILIDEFGLACTSDLTDVEVDRFRAHAYREFAASTGRPVLLKHHDRFGHGDRGEATIPLDVTVGVLYIVRNPLDVAPSFAHHLGRSVDQAIKAMADPRFTIGGGSRTQIRQHLGTWSAHVASWLDEAPVRRLLVRYEDMVDDSAATFGQMARFVGLPDDEEEVRHALELTTFDRLQAIEADVGFGERDPLAPSFFRRGGYGTWRDSLSVAQRDRIVADHGVVMERLGYLVDGEVVDR
jgi:aryl sulfotransferase